MMVFYYERIPAAAVQLYPDGHCYAYSYKALESMDDGRVTVREGSKPRLFRAKPETATAGEVLLYLGCAGSAIACTVNLPYGVEVK